MNRTGLPGRYDFKLDWTPDAGPCPAPADGQTYPAEMADPSGRPSIFTALQKQRFRRQPSIRLDSATSLEELRALRGNWLEALSGACKGQFSIRINDQYRICFKWKAKGPIDVEITDCH